MVTNWQQIDFSSPGYTGADQFERRHTDKDQRVASVCWAAETHRWFWCAPMYVDHAQARSGYTVSLAEAKEMADIKLRELGLL